jgi:Fe-S-cluster containining protein
MEGKIYFKCLKCGKCCRNLLKDEDGVVSGLMLFPDEIGLFPDKFVYPGLGLGFNRFDPAKPESIICYQLDLADCPYLSQENECQIYQKRPLICQVFPLHPMGSIGTSIVEPDDCAFVKKVESEIGDLSVLLPLTPEKFEGTKEWVFVSVMNAKYKTLFGVYGGKDKPPRRFDLRKKEWVFTI